MSTPQIILWVTALAVGVPALFFGRNPTAGALFLAFAASQFGLPHEYYAWPDAFTIFVIILKREWLRADIFTFSDLFILLSFPLSWAIYIMEGQIPHFYWWWSLMIIALTQFVAAGLEP